MKNSINKLRLRGLSKMLFALTLLFLLTASTKNTNAQEAYTVLENGELTFYYNNKKPEGALPIQSDYTDVSWPEEVRNSVTKVVFDHSFKNYQPTSSAFWFYGFVNLTEISGMNTNLNSEKITNVKLMFCDCSSLTTLDLSGFNTSNITSMNGMFAGCSGLTSLDLSGFNTEKVKDMAYMFYECSGLTTVDLSSFDTENVETMSSMFEWCKKLSSLDLKHFNTKNVSNMGGMFRGCNSLTILDLSNFNTEKLINVIWMFCECDNLNTINISSFNTENVQTMEGMFRHCNNLTSLDLSNFKTENVTIMEDMFLCCYKLTSLDLSSFNTGKVTNMSNMFYECNNLNTIFVGDGWLTSSVTQPTEMFKHCYQLYGGKGTFAPDMPDDIKYAKIDGGENNPGFFTKSGDPVYVPNKQQPYVVIEDNVATFFYGTMPEGAMKLRHMSSWGYSDYSNIEKVVFDESFRSYHPKNCSNWFSGFTSLTEIVGMKENLNTADVWNFSYMFYDCYYIKSLDLSGFNTDKATNMKEMFNDCASLKSIFVGDGWSTASVPASTSMFENCKKLYGGKGTAYNASHTDATYAQIDKEGTPGYLTKDGEPAFAPTLAYAIVKDGVLTFYYNKSQPESGSLPIRTSSEDSNWPTSVCNSITKVVFDESFKDYKTDRTSCWFYGFGNLTNIVGIKENLNTENVEYMFEMFQFCDKLKSVDLSGFNTANVKDMSFMFYGSGVRTIDISSFNTANVTNMYYMFGACENLRTIYVGDNWSTASVTKSDEMFYACPKLYGGKGTHCQESNILFARVDGGVDNPGYFTKVGETPFKAPEIYVTVKDGIATFCHNNAYPDDYDFLPLRTVNKDNNWTSDLISSITKVVFDESFKDVKPTTCANWFSQMENLTEISGMNENLNTEDVTDMSYMFYSCNSLSSLDLSGFYTSKVTKMYRMLSGCENLKYVFVGDGWNTSSVTSSDYMFGATLNIYGGQGSNPVEIDLYDATCARIDGGVNNPGYFTRVGETPYTPVTPVSSISTPPSILVWSASHTIFISNAPADTEYQIIDLNGRVITTSTTKSTREEVSINNTGVVIVLIDHQSFKVMVQ